MKLFHCDNCSQAIYFENTQCMGCQSTLGYLPDQHRMGALRSTRDDLWASVTEQPHQHSYRMCKNYSEYGVCNWMVPADSSEPLCIACRLNRTIPDLDVADHLACWSRLEAAKHRLVYGLSSLGLPLNNKQDDPQQGLAFDFLAGSDPDFAESTEVITGYTQGVITINIAEADDAVREKMRLDMNERYRTVLGHFRHEAGHYYWQQLVCNSAWLDAFRNLFGDEQQDYSSALQRHYDLGPCQNWQERHISAYASSHPLEDWAETWAHYMHITDMLETARAFGLTGTDASLRLPAQADSTSLPDDPFERLIAKWLPLTFALNSINRSMGLQDIYPFILTTPVISKLSFVHRVVGQSSCQ